MSCSGVPALSTKSRLFQNLGIATVVLERPKVWFWSSVLCKFHVQFRCSGTLGSLHQKPQVPGKPGHFKDTGHTALPHWLSILEGVLRACTVGSTFVFIASYTCVHDFNNVRKVWIFCCVLPVWWERLRHTIVLTSFERTRLQRV